MEVIFAFLRNLGRPVKLVAGAGILLIAFGAVCRIVPFYFFWESIAVGIVLLILAAILFLVGSLKTVRQNDKRHIGEKIGIGILSFILFVMCLLQVITLNSDAWAATKRQLQNDPELRAELGTIQGFSLMPMGGLSVTSSSGGDAGYGNFRVIVKGERRYKMLEVVVSKTVDSPWLGSYP
ncbi:MAG: hypothetical protein U0T79_00365 [Ferruginibacter sp.]